MKFSQTRNEQKSYHKRMMSLNSFNSKTQTEQLWQAMASIAECEEHLIAFNKLTPDNNWKQSYAYLIWQMLFNINQWIFFI